jgi:MYXO-CTERM domain-containing protein
MKRLASSVFVAASIPATMFFVLTAGAARLYAEAGVPIVCTEPEFEACATKALHDPCSFDGGTGNCDIGSCFDTDGGLHLDRARLFCQPNLGAGDDGGGADAGRDAAADGAAPYTGSDAAEIAIGDVNDAGLTGADDASDAPGALDGSANGSAPTNDSGCSCRTAGTSPDGAAGASAGLLIAFGAFLRLRGRPTKR